MLNLYTKAVDGVWYGIASEEERVFATSFGFSKEAALHSLLNSIPFNMLFEHSEKASVFADRVAAILKDIYDGIDVSHSVSLVTEHLSNYARRVIEAVSLVPSGYVSSYGSVALAVGGSPRAVGRVMALNPFPLIVPCHRVVGADFGLCGYGGGLKLKLDILRRERRGYASGREILMNRKKLRLFPLEFVLKKYEKANVNSL